MLLLLNYIQLYLTTSHLNTFLLISSCCVYYCSSWRILFLLISFQCITHSHELVVFGLQNSLAAIHPLLMLGLYSILLKIFFSTKICFSFKTSYHYIIVGFITLSLGGWWAFQEFNWGGWWNWDSIETPVFLTFFFITFLLFHNSSINNIKIFSFITKLHNLKWFLYSLIMIIYLPRFGLTNSVHSFISNTMTYKYYLSSNLYFSLPINFFYVVLRNISLWTFFFVKIFLLVILNYAVIIYFIKNRYSNHMIDHKLIYTLIFFLICINYKNVTLYFSTINVFLPMDWLNNKIFQIYNLTTNEVVFWYKPTTVSVNLLFISLKNFLN